MRVVKGGRKLFNVIEGNHKLIIYRRSCLVVGGKVLKGKSLLPNWQPLEVPLNDQSTSIKAQSSILTCSHYNFNTHKIYEIAIDKNKTSLEKDIPQLLVICFIHFFI